MASPALAGQADVVFYANGNYGNFNVDPNYQYANGVYLNLGSPMPSLTTTNDSGEAWTMGYLIYQQSGGPQYYLGVGSFSTAYQTNQSNYSAFDESSPSGTGTWYFTSPTYAFGDQLAGEINATDFNDDLRLNAESFTVQSANDAISKGLRVFDRRAAARGAVSASSQGRIETLGMLEARGLIGRHPYSDDSQVLVFEATGSFYNRAPVPGAEKRFRNYVLLMNPDNGQLVAELLRNEIR